MPGRGAARRCPPHQAARLAPGSRRPRCRALPSGRPRRRADTAAAPREAPARCIRAGHVLGGQFPVADRGGLRGDPVLHVGMMPERPQRVGECGRGRVVAGQHEDQQVVADVVVGDRPTRSRGRWPRAAPAPAVHHGSGSARHACRISLVTSTHRGHRRAGARRAGVGQPPRCTHRAQRAVGGVARRDVHGSAIASARSLRSRPEHRAAQRPHRHPSALDVEVDLCRRRAIRRRRLGGTGHVATETADVLPGEHRLQGPLARHPRLVGQDEQAVARQVAYLLVHDAPLGRCVVAAQHVADGVGREDRHQRRQQPCWGPSCMRLTGRRRRGSATCPVSSVRTALTKSRRRQRVARGQRQRRDASCRSVVRSSGPS